MPRLLDTSSKQSIVLDSDQSKPVECQPRLFFHTLSIRKSDKVGAMIEEFGQAPDSKKLHRMIVEAVVEVIIGWENMRDAQGNEIPFSPEAVWDIFTIPEAHEILQKVLRASATTGDEEKKSE